VISAVNVGFDVLDHAQKAELQPKFWPGGPAHGGAGKAGQRGLHRAGKAGVAKSTLAAKLAATLWLESIERLLDPTVRASRS